MAFSFKRKESVSKAIRRLGCQRAKNALECLASLRDPRGIHTARKDIKKLRALFRLVQAETSKKSYRRVIKILRDAAQELGPTRDAHVIAAAFKDLRRHFAGQIVPSAFRKTSATLQETVREESRRFTEQKSVRKVQSLFRQAAKVANGFSVHRDGWKAIHPGIKRAYREGQRAYRLAAKSPSDENFHEWRKCCKDLWYQAKLLRPIWPEQLDAVAGELKELTEFLGDDHDLAMLQEAAAKDERAARETESLCALIQQRQRDLRDAALRIGARFFSEKPAEFSDRLGAYWQAWKKEKSRRKAPGHDLAEIP